MPPAKVGGTRTSRTLRDNIHPIGLISAVADIKHELECLDRELIEIEDRLTRQRERRRIGMRKSAEKALRSGTRASV